jgi:hypothetical protein
MRVAGFALALVSLAALAAGAKAEETNSEYAFINAAQGCQLSGPTIITKAAPRATGFRNDGATNVFVICGTSLPTDDGLLTSAALWLYSTSTEDVAVNCTFVSGSGSTYLYKPKILDLPAHGGLDKIYVWGGDYGGAEVTYGFNVTVTCLLPPKVAILRTESTYELNIGA